jgi:histidine triad (HIT) family protein
MTTTYQPDCIFCKISRHEMPAAIIYEDEQVIAFMDAFPSAEGHALVVPKKHHADVLSLPVPELQAAATIAQRVAQTQMRVLKPDGIIVTQFNGAAAGQTIFHYHIHIVPRWENQDPAIHGKAQADPAKLMALAERLKI